MGKKRTIWKKKLFDDASIRSMIFIYFTITALAASVLMLMRPRRHADVPA